MITTTNISNAISMLASAWGNFNPFASALVLPQGANPLEPLAIENKTWNSLTGEFTFTFEGDLEACTLESDTHGVLTAVINGNTATFDFSAYGNDGATFESDFELVAQPLDSQFGNTITTLNFVITSGHDVYADEGRESTASEILIKLNADGNTQRIHGDKHPDDIEDGDTLEPDIFYTPDVTEEQQREYESNGHKGIELYLSPTPGSEIIHEEAGNWQIWDDPNLESYGREGKWDGWDDQLFGTDNALDPIIDMRTYLKDYHLSVWLNGNAQAQTDLFLEDLLVGVIKHSDVFSLILTDGDHEIHNHARWAKPTVVFGEGDKLYYGYRGADTIVLNDWSGDIDIRGYSSGSQENGLDTVRFNFEGRTFTTEELLEGLNAIDVLDLGNGEYIPFRPDDTKNGAFTLNLDTGDATLLSRENERLDGAAATGSLIIKGDSNDTVNFSGGPLLKLESGMEGYDRYVELEKVKRGTYHVGDNEFYIDATIIVTSQGNIHDPENPVINFTGTNYLDLSFPLVADAF